MNKLLISSRTTKSPINSSRHANITNRHHYSHEQHEQKHQQLDNTLNVNATSLKSSKNRLVTSTTKTTRTTHSSSTCSTEEDAETSSSTRNKNTNLFKKILEFEKISQQQQSQPGFLLLSCTSPTLSSSFNYSSSGSSSSFNSRSSPIPAADEKAGFMYTNFKTCGNNSLVANTGASCVYKTLRSRQVYKTKKKTNSHQKIAAYLI